MVFLTLRKAYLNYLRKKKEANNAKKNLKKANNALKRANNQYNMVKRNNFPVGPMRRMRVRYNNGYHSINIPNNGLNNFKRNYRYVSDPNGGYYVTRNY
jgi:hypothetical protein